MRCSRPKQKLTVQDLAAGSEDDRVVRKHLHQVDNRLDAASGLDESHKVTPLREAIEELEHGLGNGSTVLRVERELLRGSEDDTHAAVLHDALHGLVAGREARERLRREADEVGVVLVRFEDAKELCVWGGVRC